MIFSDPQHGRPTCRPFALYVLPHYSYNNPENLKRILWMYISIILVCSAQICLSSGILLKEFDRVLSINYRYHHISALSIKSCIYKRDITRDYSCISHAFSFDSDSDGSLWTIYHIILKRNLIRFIVTYKR